ncbi:hypothetical protein SRHO_G00054910 [Serrasalmus rhombeus]
MLSKSASGLKPSFDTEHIAVPGLIRRQMTLNKEYSLPTAAFLFPTPQLWRPCYSDAGCGIGRLGSEIDYPVQSRDCQCVSRPGCQRQRGMTISRGCRHGLSCSTCAFSPYVTANRAPMQEPHSLSRKGTEGATPSLICCGAEAWSGVLHLKPLTGSVATGFLIHGEDRGERHGKSEVELERGKSGSRRDGNVDDVYMDPCACAAQI